MARPTGSYSYASEQQEIADSLGFKSADTAMLDLYYRDSTCSEIAEKFGLLRKHTVINRLKKLGVKMRPRGGKNCRVKISFNAYVDIMTGGDSAVCLAKKYGISKPTVLKIKRGYVGFILSV